MNVSKKEKQFFVVFLFFLNQSIMHVISYDIINLYVQFKENKKLRLFKNENIERVNNNERCDDYMMTLKI